MGEVVVTELGVYAGGSFWAYFRSRSRQRPPVTFALSIRDQGV
jgi:hypothetical protein